MPTEEWGADWLYQEITSLGWHPFFRINHQGQYCIPDSDSWQSLATVLSRENPNWSGQVTCFKSNPIDCTLKNYQLRGIAHVTDNDL